ncbi:L-lactate dehydrogenase [Terrilactibacillus sp. BCM23-1]|uniref:L-lactate dehydrogenase n=1 Tax=Terrilactibacillus tamarindi TaxID=2599694 RepID=A0A6N8CP31_9BACI|nr:L-lactate dehydrogenase [Terrilactibacillus tamarindi]MTT31924.1 L-lactate dehydrogenase [Terrilactibacillus tamarindi]
MTGSIRRIGIIGVGNVGSAAAFSVIHQGICEELTLVDIKKEKSIGEAIDFADSIGFLSFRTKVKSGELLDLKNCDVILISVAGEPLKPGETRLDLLKGTSAIIKDIIPPLKEAGFNGIYVVATNPCDVITYLTWKLSGLPRNQVIGTGTALDSSRFRKLLSEHLNVDSRSITAYMLGEHGESQFGAWSHVSIGGKPIRDYIEDHKENIEPFNFDDLSEHAKREGWNVFNRKGKTEYGIGNALAFIAKAILNDAYTISPVSAVLEGEYGQNDLAIGVPGILCREGLKQVIELDLDEKEQTLFKNSANVIKDNIASVKL